MATPTEPKFESSRPLKWDTAMQQAIKRAGFAPQQIPLTSKVAKKYVESEKGR